MWTNWYRSYDRFWSRTPPASLKCEKRTRSGILLVWRPSFTSPIWSAWPRPERTSSCASVDCRTDRRCSFESRTTCSARTFDRAYADRWWTRSCSRNRRWSSWTRLRPTTRTSRISNWSHRCSKRCFHSSTSTTSNCERSSAASCWTTIRTPVWSICVIMLSK